ncbi:triple gene block protein I [Jasmine virus C]|uniref:triple gene block protein I n=1 Tax=Jasmine virus C TaxID=1853762 RepID=UPI0007DDCF9B|nr:triple gene block protein I [Jasmine virus C]ANH22486.1 triple gene block I [Jasmine virus C]AON75921.1 triple gene block protein I [Jasmine virus C]
MELLLNKLESFGFTRVSSALRLPLIVHCVPGAGKSSLIRAILEDSVELRAYTFGQADQPNLIGNYIRPFTSDSILDQRTIIDEYTLSPQPIHGVLALFGDPRQPGVDQGLVANFLGNFSRRFGANTAIFLRKLGFNVHAEGEDTVRVLDIFKAEPSGVIVCFEPEVQKLLCAHNLEYLTAQEIQGSTFQEVSFIVSGPFQIERAREHFLCLTRHRATLNILCPDATYTTS